MLVLALYRHFTDSHQENGHRPDAPRGSFLRAYLVQILAWPLPHTNTGSDMSFKEAIDDNCSIVLYGNKACVLKWMSHSESALMLSSLVSSENVLCVCRIDM